MQTIGVCGLGYTGSGAIIDLLAEFDGLKVLSDPEFSIVYAPDGIEDLEYHIVKAPSRFMSSDVAIYRFKKLIKGKNNRGSGIRRATENRFYTISMKYIDEITQLTWRGYWGWDFVSAGILKKNLVFRILNNRITPLIGKVLHRNIDWPPIRDMNLSINPGNFYIASKKYIDDLICAMGVDDTEIVVLNQPFAADHPTKSFPFFENPYAIIVDRDPRDIYVLMKRLILEEGRFIPSNNVQDFIKYYALMHENQESTLNDKRVIHIQFEDLIYKYDETVRKLQENLGLFGHTRKKDLFNPEVSINNTQLFLRYPDFINECKTIEDSLSEWLYPFENFVQKPNWRSMSF